MEGLVKEGKRGGLLVPRDSRNGSRSWSWPSYMCCGVRADVGWLLVDDRPQWPTTVMDDAEKER